ncbi:MAG: hypothetical protein U0556_06570 [Dehalococcoidia bacterium]
MRRAAGALRPPASRTLIRLTDFGPARRLTPKEFGLESADRSWNTWADSFLQVNRPAFEALDLVFGQEASRDGLAPTIRAAGTVGAVPIRHPQSGKAIGGVVVAPRFGWHGIGPVLSQTGWSAAPAILDQLPTVPGSSREVPPWVLGGPVVQRLGAMLHHLRRGYALRTEVRQQPRGTILWNRYAVDQVARGRPYELVCRFPDLGVDQTLRRHLRWGLERTRASLFAAGGNDWLARALILIIEHLLVSLQDVPAVRPTHSSLARLERANAVQIDTLVAGVQALGWVLDERGLAGTAVLDGLAWRMTMAELFERWCEALARHWAATVGGQVSVGMASQFPVRWQSRDPAGLTALRPDIIVQRSDAVYVLDAKYKNHLQDIDEERWFELAEDARAEHRADVHQVLAYTGLFDSPRVVSSLLYPLRYQTWERLRYRGRVVRRAAITTGSRTIELAIIGVPIDISRGTTLDEITADWGLLLQEFDDWL